MSSIAQKSSVLIPATSSSKVSVAKLLIDEGCTCLTLLNFGVTGLEFTKSLRSQIIVDEYFKIRSVILQYVSGCQGDE